jgi:hypothetical protein
MFAALFIFSVFGSAFGAIASGGQVMYDNKEFESYAMEHYYAEFGETGDSFEDNLLIAFMTDEERGGYYTIAIIGDNVKYEISDMFGNEYTEFGRAMLNSIDPDDYTYSLSRGLDSAVRRMASAVEAKNLGSNFYEEYSHEDSPKSHVVNNSDLSVNETTVNRALEDFTERTDIPVVIVIDSMEEVFGKGFTAEDIFSIIIAVALIALAVVIIVKSVKNAKKQKGQNNNSNNKHDPFANL